jgi:tetratricopeptide (TPR) repeat protein
MTVQCRQIRALFALLFCIIWIALAERQSSAAIQEHEHPVPEKLGSVKFPTSCSANVQKEFERAVALLHSFAYSAAEKAFRDLTAKDPNCAIAHWGVAMSYFHQLWEPHVAAEDLARGQLELEQARRLGSSERERGFIDALNLIYAKADSVPYAKRANDYTLAMAKLAERNPDDVECQVFYALALIATASPTDKTHANEKQAAALLEPLFRKYPEHPGIPHYLIHAYDNSEMASRGVAAAEVYSRIAPSAPHALHMPSHIYTRLGMWEKSVASNLAARKAAHVQGDIGEELHAMDYLTYANLQLGRDAEAERVLKDLSGMSGLPAGEFKVGYAASAMPVRYAIERRRWAQAARLEPLAGAQPQVSAITGWARVVALARSGEPTAARKELAQLKTAYEKLRASGDDYWATQVHVQLTEAQGWIAHAEGKEDEALKLMRNAADEEDAVEKRPVTPGVIVPAREQLGDLLLELNRPEQALKEFERALAMTPQRRNALEGASRAREIVGAGKAQLKPKSRSASSSTNH